MHTFGLDSETGEKNELYAAASSRLPRFKSAKEARAHFSSQLEKLAHSQLMTIDELVRKAYASETNDDLTQSVLSLVRKLSHFNRV